MSSLYIKLQAVPVYWYRMWQISQAMTKIHFWGIISLSILAYWTPLPDALLVPSKQCCCPSSQCQHISEGSVIASFSWILRWQVIVLGHKRRDTYTFSCASQDSHTSRSWTSAGGRPWSRSDGTGCASCYASYQRMTYPSSETHRSNQRFRHNFSRDGHNSSSSAFNFSCNVLSQSESENHVKVICSDIWIG